MCSSEIQWRAVTGDSDVVIAAATTADAVAVVEVATHYFWVLVARGTG